MKKTTLLLALLLPFIGFSQEDITFQVDMNQYPGSFNAVEVFGTFNNFQGGVSIMTDGNNDGVYDVTVAIPTGPIEFLFAVDTGTFNYVVEDFTGTQPFCTVTSGNFTNRAATVSADSTYAVVCWEACVDCASAPTNSEVTFQVDMSQYTGTYNQVNLNGTFNGFCGSCAVMTDANNDMIYELTVTVPNDSIEWIFTLDGFGDAESFNPGDPCTLTTIATPDTFTNRFMVVSGDTTLPDVCYGYCVDCASIGTDENWINDFSISPNPTTGLVMISGQLNSSNQIDITIFDIQGKQVYAQKRANASSLNEEIDLQHLADGIYVMTINNGQNVLQEKIVLTR